MKYTKEDITCKLLEYPSLLRKKQQLEFELSLLRESISDSVDAQTSIKLMELVIPISNEQRRMEYYLTLLPEEDGAVLTALYLDKLTYKETASKLSVDTKTIVNRRNQGLSELASMYSLLPED